jgi:hypothetical protein
MGEQLERERSTGFTDEQLLALTGLRVAVNPSAWRIWREAMPDSEESVEVAIARIEWDANGRPVAFGIRRAEMTRTIEENGDPTSNSAHMVGLEPDRIFMLTPDGQDMWFPATPSKEAGGVDIFELPYI